MLKKAFRKQYDGIIWKIIPDETGSCLVLEIRSGNKKKTFFSGISLPSGTPAFNDLQLQEKWFCGLEGVAHGRAYLHGYLSETLPGHRGIFAVDLKNGSIVWEDYNLVYGQAVKEGLIAWNYKSEPRRHQLIDPLDGTTIRTITSAQELENYSASLPAEPVHFPSRIKLDNDWLAHLPAGALPGADLLERNGRWLLAFYTPAASGASGASATPAAITASPPTATSPPTVTSGAPAGSAAAGRQKMDHHLYVIDRNRQLIHKDLLARDILQPAMDTFFVMSNQLFYIRSKSEILAYFL